MRPCVVGQNCNGHCTRHDNGILGAAGKLALLAIKMLDKQAVQWTAEQGHLHVCARGLQLRVLSHTGHLRHTGQLHSQQQLVFTTAVQILHPCCIELQLLEGVVLSPAPPR